MKWILFEWKLIIRNKRLIQMFITSVLLLPFIIYTQLATSGLVKEIFLFKEFFLWAMFAMPAHFATLAFSCDAAFIEKLVITRGAIFQQLQAKYKLYAVISLALFILFLPSMFLGVKLIELAAALVFAVGFVFFGLFWTSLYSYKPFNIKASYFYNFQGIDTTNYFSPILVILVAFGFTALFYWIFNETIALIAMSLIGVVFITTNKIWLKQVSANFKKSKYRRLDRFREIN